MEAPETRYVQRPDGVAIAYQTFGVGERTIVYVPGFISHLDLMWTEPQMASFLERMATWGRVVTFDKPGTGCSDPIDHVPAIDERAEDIRLVMDAAGVDRATVMGFSEGVSSCVLFAASRPERVERLVLYGGIARGYPSEDECRELDVDPDMVRRRWARIESIVNEWGRGRALELFSPTVQSAFDRRAIGLFERAAASPRMARALLEAARAIDIRPALGSIQAPTLILHRVDDFVPVQQSRVMAERIAGAQYRELPGSDHAFWRDDPELVLSEVERFLAVEVAPARSQRALATVLFTDVVGSTARAADLGDAGWRAELEGLERLAMRIADSHGGRVVKSLGDGHLSTFPGPAGAIECATELIETAQLPLRAGVHTGECELMGDDLGGLAVHIGARVGALAGPGEVLVSSTVRDLLMGSGLEFGDRGEHDLKGVPGRWRVYGVGRDESLAPIPAERELRTGDRLALRVAQRAPHRIRRAWRLAGGQRR